MTQPVLVAIGLGANLGPAEETLSWAISQLAAVLSEARLGGLYRSPPEGGAAGPDYLNTALVGLTRASPEQLLALGKALEAEAGRERGPRGAPRPLDVDLLFYGEVVRDDPELTLPHPRLRRRAFVLAPLADVAPDLALPPDGATVAEVLAAADRTGLERVGWRAV